MTLTTDLGRSIRVSIFEHVNWWLGPLLVSFSIWNESGERCFLGPNRVEFTPSAYYTCSQKWHQQVQFRVEINSPTIAPSRVKPRHFVYKSRWVCSTDFCSRAGSIRKNWKTMCFERRFAWTLRLADYEWRVAAMQGWRLVELTEACYSEGNSQDLPLFII